MSGATDNLVLKHLRALRDAANDALSAALQTERIDRMQARLDRIETRLELSDA